MRSPDQDGFLRIVRALAPYLDQLVIAGAWCHRLLHFHPSATSPAYTTLMTEDADVVAHERLLLRSPSIHEALTAGGFYPRLSGSGRLPVMKYFPKDDDQGMYVEFIAPLVGGALTRAGEPNDLLEVAGITAQKLRYVDLLLRDPWQLALSEQHGFEVGSDKVVVQVANPGSYLVQKLLTLRMRKNPAKRSKDALYIHDTVAMFGAALAELRESGARVLDHLPPKTRREFHELRVELFANDDLVTRAAEIAAATGRASPPSPATIRDVCTEGLRRIFAP